METASRHIQYHKTKSARIMAKALYREWRPQNWDEVVAQEHIIQTLRNAVIGDRVAHAYLFAGPRGTGKTTTARLLAKAVNCLEPDLKKRPCNACEHCLALNAGRFLDLIEIDAASNTSVDDVRDLRDKINFSPSQGKFKVYIIDEVHMLSTAAFNALLKTLEEPPPHAIFILATTEIHKIPATVLSRCQRHEFRRIPLEDIVHYLKEQSKAEGFRVEDSVFVEIARQATGSLRDAISLLDQLASTGKHLTLEMAQSVLGTATSNRVLEIIDALLEQDAAQGLTHINQALNSGSDPRQLARQIVSYLRNVLLYKMGNRDQLEISKEARPKVDQHAAQFSTPELLRAIESFNQATIREQANWHPGLGLELAFTTYLAQPAIPIDKAMQSSQPSPIPQKPVETGEQKTPAVTQPKRKKRSETTQKQPTPQATPPQTSSPEKQPASQTAAKGEQPAKSADQGQITTTDLQNAWNRIKSMVGRHNPRTEGLLTTCKMTAIEGNTLIMGFASETLKNMMEKEGNITLTTDILEEVLGQPLVIKCIVTSHQGSVIPNDVEIDKDGMVSAATRDLGGKIRGAEEAQ